jgi:hypothetical protein
VSGLSVWQLRIFVVQPTLIQIGHWSQAAEELLLGTAAHESGGFRFLDQLTDRDDTVLGPAIGLYQMEKATHDDLWTTYLRYRDALAQRIGSLLAQWPDRHVQLATNLAYATAMARIRYLRVPELMPAANDLPGLAGYYKRHWSTHLGKATEQDFINAYNKHVKP